MEYDKYCGKICSISYTAYYIHTGRASKTKQFLGMDKIHIYRNDEKTFGGRTNKYLTRIGRICGGQDGVSCSPI